MDKYAILAYHGVTKTLSEGIENFSGKHIQADEFEKHISYICENMNPVSLRKMACSLGSGISLPKESISITFDDCYKNVHDVALPILRKYDVPATFFISTGFVETNRLFWTDLLECIINKTEVESFNIVLGNSNRSFDLLSKNKKINAIIEIKTNLKKCTPTIRDTILGELRDKLNVDVGANNVKNYLNLSWNDIIRLNDPPNYEVGGHTVNHEILAYLEEPLLKNEINDCLCHLNDALNNLVDLFSYPEGQHEHFNNKVISFLIKAGITICPSTVYGFNHLHADSFYLKRIMPGFMNTPFPFSIPN